VSRSQGGGGGASGGGARQLGQEEAAAQLASCMDSLLRLEMEVARGLSETGRVEKKNKKKHLQTATIHARFTLPPSPRPESVTPPAGKVQERVDHLYVLLNQREQEYHELSALREEDSNLLYEGLHTFHMHLHKSLAALRFDLAEARTGDAGVYAHTHTQRGANWTRRCTHTHTHTHTHMHTHAYIHIHVYTYVCMRLYLCICMGT
jgi:hypothetical protein